MAAEDSFDVVVIGGGPGGYVAAIRAAQLGLKSACVEFRGALGGTCLNVGCIPSKALLESSEMYDKIAKHSKDYGVNVDGVKADVPAMIGRKNTIVQKFTRGIEGLFKKNKVSYLKGLGSIVSANEVEVTDDSGAKKRYQAKNIVIATGSEPVEIPIAKFDGKTIVSSTEALDFEKPPKHMVVIGGGVIGLELGSVWSRLGSEVTVIEALPKLLMQMDDSISKAMPKILGAQGLKFHLGTKVTGVELTKKGAVVKAETDSGEAIEFPCDKVLVSVGRRAFTNGLGLENVGVEVDQRGKVKVNNHLQTSQANIYAIGDVIDGPMLAHKAEEEGAAVAEMIAGKPGHVNYEAIPGIIYTWPEVAAVGRTEQQCKEEGIEFKTGQFPYIANGRAICAGHSDGFVKIIADAKTDRILGAHMVGPSVSELISEIVVAIEFGASAEDIARSMHGHPTLSEATKEAAMAVDKRAIHI